MNNTPKIYWLNHCRCWFGFTEPAQFVTSPAGGYFAAIHTRQQIFSVIQAGYKKPFEYR